jgi:hypothetical protein
MRKSPVKFVCNNVKYSVAVNDCVPGGGYVNVLTQRPIKLVDTDTAEPAIMLYVLCNAKSYEPGRIYALFYNTVTKKFDGNFTVN